MRNLTPQHLRCAPLHCPSIHQMDSGEYLIVGRSATMAAACERIPVGEGEHAVIVSGELVGNVPRTWMAMDSAPKGSEGIDDTRDPAYVKPTRILLRFGEEGVSVAYWDWAYAEGGYYCRDGFAWIEPVSGEPLNLTYSTAPDGWLPLPPTEKVEAA